MISAQSIERVKAVARLSEVVGERVSLRRQGSSLVGLCPFHGEKSPSFHVHNDDGFYHCFGCGASGNVVTFVMETQGLSFPMAIEQLAERYEVRLERSDNKSARGAAEHDNRPALYKATTLAFDFFKSCLRSAPSEVAKYIQSRGLLDDSVADFAIGFAPLGWRVLVDHLKQAGVSEADMIGAGLVARSPKGDLYDVFRGRLIIPVFVDGKRIAGFGGRIIPGLEPEESAKKAAKYINSRETAIYKKSQVLFGLPQALPHIRAEKRVFMVEGYLDVVSLHKVGVGAVVAACGTAITEQHVKRLSNLAQQVIILFDGDNAGRSAAGKAFEVFVNSGVDASALFLPEGEDPDTFAGQHGSLTREMLNKVPKEPLFDCYIDYRTRDFGADRVELLGAAAKGKLAEALVSVIRKVVSAVEREALKQRICHRLLIEPTVIEQLIKGKNDRVFGRATESPALTAEAVSNFLTTEPPHQVQRVSELSPVSRDLLRAVMVLKNEVGNDLLRLPEVTLLDPSALAFIGLYMQLISESATADAAKEKVKALLVSFGADWVELWKSAFAMADDKTANYRKVVSECVRSLQVQALRAALKRNRERIGACAPGDVAEFVQTNIQLERKLRELGGRI